MYYTSYSDFLNFIDSFILEVEEFEKRQEIPKLPRPQPKIIILIINEGTPFPSGRSPPFFARAHFFKKVLTFSLDYVIIKILKGEIKMSTSLIAVLIALFFFALIVGYVIYLLIPTDQNTTIYKDYRIGENVFTIHLYREKDCLSDLYDVRVKICEWHLPPRSRWEYSNQFFKIKVYRDVYWRPSLTSISLEDFIIQEIEEVIKTEEKKLKLDKEWEEFCEINNIEIDKEETSS